MTNENTGPMEHYSTDQDQEPQVDASRVEGSSDVQSEEDLEKTLEQEMEQALGDMNVFDLADGKDQPADSSTGSQTSSDTSADIRAGRVVAVRGDDVFVEFGGKDQGVVSASQFADEGVPAVGDTVELQVEGYNESEGLLELSRQGAVQSATWSSLEPGRTVEGRVTALNTGGLELDVNGIRAFMPISHIELNRVEDLSPYVNCKMQCRVLEVNRKEKNVIVSRRELLREEADASRKETLNSIQEGAIVHGRVKNIMPYGAFVDIGGTDGLLHISDLSHSRVGKVDDVVKVGQELDVKILQIERENGKIRLGLKQVAPDPWENITEKYPVDTLISGRVTRLADFGAFVELETGVEGLVPMGEMSWERRIGKASEVVNEGDTVKVRIINVDPNKRRIGLSLKRVGDDPWMGASTRWPADSIVDGRVTRLADFGAFIELSQGVEGLVHISEISHEHIRTVGDALNEGQQVSCKVLEVDEDKRRISLSIKEAAAPDASAQMEEPPMPPSEEPRRRKKRKKPLKGGLDIPWQ